MLLRYFKLETFIILLFKKIMRNSIALSLNSLRVSHLILLQTYRDEMSSYIQFDL